MSSAPPEDPLASAPARLVIVDGPAPTPTLELAQRLSLQLAHRGHAVELLTPQLRGHPLRRPADATHEAAAASDDPAYADRQAWQAALQQQWQNFAVRAGAEGGCWIAAGAWLDTAVGDADADAAAAALARSLLEALQPLPTELVMLSTMTPADADHAAYATRAFAAVQTPRTLLNSDRLTMAELVAEGLALLGETAIAVEVDAGLRQQLQGHYGSSKQAPLELLDEDGGLHVRGPAPIGVRLLLPGPDGRLHVAGCALTLSADLDAQGRCRGLFAQLDDPTLGELDPYLPRSD